MKKIILTKDMFMKNEYWLDTNTFISYFSIIPDELIKKYELGDCDWFYGEYHEDDNTFHYIIDCEDGYIDVTDLIDESINEELYKRAMEY